MTFVRRTLFALLVLAMPVAAAAGPAVSVAPQPDAPVKIDSCKVGFLPKEGSFYPQDYYTRQALTFHNAGTHTANLVRFRFAYRNAAGHTVGSLFATDHGEFSPRVSVVRGFGKWQERYVFRGVTTVRCSVDRVKFDGGTEWVHP